MDDLSFVECTRNSPLRDTSLLEMLQWHVSTHPDEEIFILRHKNGSRHSLTYKELYQKGLKIASFLSESGLIPRERVILMGPNSLQWTEALAGILLAGGTICLPPPCYDTGQHCAELVSFLQSEYIFIEPGFEGEFFRTTLNILSDCDSIFKKIIFLRKIENDFDGCFDFVFLEDIYKTYTDDFKSPAMTPDDILLVCTTTGSTGMPKLVLHTHASILNLNRNDPKKDLYPKRPKFNDKPFGWLGGDALLNIDSGTPRVFTDQKLIEHTKSYTNFVWKVISEENVLMATVLPEFLEDMLPLCSDENDTNGTRFKLKYFIVGSLVIAKRHTGVIGKFCDGILLTFGSTETCLVAANVLSNAQEYKIGAVGKPMPGVSLLVADESGHVVKRGTVGEIFVRTDTLCRGYLNRSNEELSFATLIRDNSIHVTAHRHTGVRKTSGSGEVISTDPWFRIGDTGAIDKNGSLIVVGRSVEVDFKKSRPTIFPGYLENVARETPTVKDAVVLCGREAECIVICWEPINAKTSEHDSELAMCIQNYFQGKITLKRFDKLPRFENGKINRPLLHRIATL